MRRVFDTRMLMLLNISFVYKIKRTHFRKAHKNSPQVHLCINLENASLQENNFEFNRTRRTSFIPIEFIFLILEIEKKSVLDIFVLAAQRVCRIALK